MAASFRFTGPACCCCNDIYKANFLELVRVKEGQAESVNEIDGVDEPDVPTKFAFDHRNKKVYYILGLDFDEIRVRNKYLNDPQVVFTLSSPYETGGASGLGIHPGNEHIYYGCSETSTPDTERYIRRVNYDGTGDVEIIHHPDNTTAGGFQARIIAVSRDDEYVFYYMQYNVALSGGKLPEIRRCNSDGSGDIQIWEAATTDDFVHQSMDVDNTNSKLIWAHDYKSGADRGSKLMRCDFDGSNLETLLDAPPGSTTGGQWWISGANWSHKHERIYYWHGYYFGSVGSAVIDDTGGLYSMLADGTDIREEVVPANEKWHPFVDEDVNQLELGCGYETTGADTLA